MAGKIPKSLTVEEAVALIINRELLSEQVDLEEMLNAFINEHEVAYDEARDDVESLLSANRIEISENRLDLAKLIRLSLKKEIELIGNGKESDLDLDLENVGIKRITTDSLRYWAAYNFGIEVPKDTTVSDGASSSNEAWNDITITLLSGNRIQASFKNSKPITKLLQAVGFMGVKKVDTPNKTFQILEKLAENIEEFEDIDNFTPSIPKSTSKAEMTRLRSCLKKLTELGRDPFEIFAPDIGWKPYFKLVDARNDAEDRIERSIGFSTFDDEHYQVEESFDDDNYPKM